jgi:hypothetical protein
VYRARDDKAHDGRRRIQIQDVALAAAFDGSIEGMPMTTRSDVADVLALELELQTDECRRDRARVLELLAEDFTEVGASGRVWDLASTLELLGAESGNDSIIEVYGLTGRIVGDGFVMTRWDSNRGGRRARRTSLWRRESAGWRLVHHQGTLLP